MELPSFDIIGCFTFLQGINFQLAAVLISIGTYAYIEHGEWLPTYTVHEPAAVKLRKVRKKCLSQFSLIKEAWYMSYHLC